MGRDGRMSEAEARLTNRWLVLGLLILVYALSAADRQLVSILAEPIRKDLGLSDAQLGLLSGLLFAFFYTVFGIPFGWLADRYNRVNILVGICVFWSACTSLCGGAASFAQMALARVGVATGEAGASGPTYSLISDYFPPDRRATMFGIYAIGYPAGSALGAAFAGWIAARYDWRMAFVAMGAVGALVAASLLLMRHPPRGRLDPAPATAAVAPPFLSVLREFLTRPRLWMTGLAAALTALPSYGVITWTPALLMRTKGMTLIDISTWYSLVSGLSMVAGMLLSGWITDWLGRYTPRAGAIVPAFASLATAPLALVAVWTPGWWPALCLMIVPFILMVMWFPPLVASIQNQCRPETRALMAALFITLCGVIGIGGGPALVGWISDLLQARGIADPLEWALTAVIPFFVVAGLAHLVSAAVIGRDERARIAG